MICLQGVERTFLVGGNRVEALAGVDLEVKAGEYLSIMGPSGSGKSTLLNVLGLLDRPDRGRYWLAGGETGNLHEMAQARLHTIGFVFQFFHLIPRLSAFQNVELPLILAGVDPRARRERVRQALDSYGLSDRLDHKPEELSGGQRQRVAIARATIMKPALLLADEPTGNLDRASGADVVAILEGLNQDGVTLVVVTHDPELGRRANRQVRMQDGRILSDSGGTS